MPNAQDITGLTGIRSDLNAKGIGGDRIGFKDGWVTVDGQNFLQPTAVKDGVSYADPSLYNTRFDTFTNQQKANQQYMDLEKLIKQPSVNPYDQQVADLLSQLTNKINNPTPYDPYTSPEYAARQAQVQRQSQQAGRQAQEGFGQSGFARSSRTLERLAGIQNDANEYLETQIVPQLVAAQQAKDQQALANLQGLLSAVSGQQGLVDSRNRDQFDALSELLGYSTDRANRAADVEYQTGRDKVMDTRYADERAHLLEREGVEDKRYDEERAYQMARDKIADEKDKRDFDEDVRRFGLNYALQVQADKRAAANSAADNSLAERRFAYEQEQDKINRADREAEKAAQAAGGLSVEDLRAETSEMLAGLRSGGLTPDQALQSIADDEMLGIYSKKDADFLRSQIGRATPNLVASKGAKTDSDLENEAKKAGFPVYDYKQWYRSPQGYASGIDFKTWQQRGLGPQLKAR